MVLSSIHSLVCPWYFQAFGWMEASGFPGAQGHKYSFCSRAFSEWWQGHQPVCARKLTRKKKRKVRLQEPDFWAWRRNHLTYSWWLRVDVWHRAAPSTQMLAAGCYLFEILFQICRYDACPLSNMLVEPASKYTASLYRSMCIRVIMWS